MALQGRLQGGSEAGDIYKRLRGLEFIAQREGIEGYVAKARFEGSDQVFIKVKPAAVREAHRIFSGGDLKAVYEAVQEDFAPEYLADREFAEEAMLDYLGVARAQRALAGAGLSWSGQATAGALHLNRSVLRRHSGS